MSRFSQAARYSAFGLTILLSAFLVFQVQPVISKIILPWFGGTPAVWTTCVLFFQLLLFAGYAYAHFTTRYLKPRWQALLHVGLLSLALLSLPITPDATWKPQGGDAPISRILFLLLMNVGLPYFLLSTTGPLLQAWFVRSNTGDSPYRLYALSNLGSLTALLSYPFVFEPWLTINDQDRFWSAAFCLFAVCCAGLAMIGSRFSASCPAPETVAGLETKTTASPWQRFVWMALPALASACLLATTNHLCQDLAVIPFLWIVPLALYLVTFIICFDRESWYRRSITGCAAMLAILLVCLANSDDALTAWFADQGWNIPINDYTNHLLFDASAYLSAMFLICMLCHGELVRSRPASDQLTAFYLCTAAGGAIGGMAVAVVCPLVFSTYAEMQICLGLGIAVAAWVAWWDAARTYLVNRVLLQKLARLGVLIVCVVVLRVQFACVAYGKYATLRNFYGVLRVDGLNTEDTDRAGRALVHGATIHGFQFDAPERRRLATTYYAPTSGVGLTLHQRGVRGPLHIGVVGLGCGTLACYGRPGDSLRFYEINPQVCDVAQNHFSFLKDTPAHVEIVLGDARLSLEQEPDQNFDVLVLDAFSSDAVPAHLLTREAFAIYRRHLRADGVLAIHTSNRHLDLPPVVTRLAEDAGWQHRTVLSRSITDNKVFAAQWLLLTNNQDFLTDERLQPAFRRKSKPTRPGPLWTDQFHNLAQVLKRD